MLVSGFAFALMSLAVKRAGDLPVHEKVFARNLVSLIVAFCMIKKSGVKVPLFGKLENQLYLISRSLLGLTGVICFFYAIDHIKMADANIISRINPAFVTIFACMFLKEKISKFQTPALILSFVFAMLVIKPSFDLSVLPSLAALVTAVCAGAAYTLVRFLSGRESAATIVFYFSFVSVVGMTPFLLMEFVMPDTIQLLWLLAIGIFASFGQFGLTLAYKYSKAAEVSIYSYSTIVFVTILGIVFESEIPDGWSIIGGLGIIGVAVVLYLHNRQQALRT